MKTPGVPVRPLPGRRYHPRPRDEIDGRGDGRRLDVRQRVRQGATRGRRKAADGRHRVHQRQQPRQACRRADCARPAELGFKLLATRGTANYLRAHKLNVDIVFKVNEGRPHVGDEILNNKIHLVINTPLGSESFFDDRTVRRIAMMHGVPSITTLTGAAAAVNAIKALRTEGLTVRTLQEYHAEAALRKS